MMPEPTTVATRNAVPSASAARRRLRSKLRISSLSLRPRSFLQYGQSREASCQRETMMLRNSRLVKSAI